MKPSRLDAAHRRPENFQKLHAARKGEAARCRRDAICPAILCPLAAGKPYSCPALPVCREFLQGKDDAFQVSTASDYPLECGFGTVGNNFGVNTSENSFTIWRILASFYHI
jgi:hypothetical protein